MDFPIDSSKLSLLAAYDDLMRVQQAIYDSVDESLFAPIKLANDYERLRKKYLHCLEEIQLKNSENEKLHKDNHLLKLHLTTVRQAYTRETSKYDTLMKDYKILAKKVTAVQDLLNEEGRTGKPNIERHNSVLSILSNLKLDTATIQEESFQTDDGLMYDKSDDSLDVLNNTVAKTPKMDKKSPAESESQSAIIPSSSFIDSPQFISKPSTSSIRAYNVAIYMRRLEATRKGAKYDKDRLDVRGHTFHKKKAFKTAIHCGSCSKSIGFCATYLICSDCRGVAHPECQATLPKPCIPFHASKTGLRKMQNCDQVGHMVLLADFAEAGSRPCVPALLIHCCNEIDRRVEVAKKNPNSLTSSLSGLYQYPTVEKEARELRLRILSGNGIPNLGNVEPNVICSVVKTFLRDLDDPVITRILWDDFVRASEHVQKISQDDGSLIDSDYESQKDNESNGSSNEEWQEALRILKGVIVQLPNANRDSLCFLFLHFYHLMDSPTVVKLSVDELSKVFAPTIVGSSRAKNSTLRLSISGDTRREGEKQIMVMQAFFKLSRQFWDRLLKDPNFCPFETVADSVNNRTVFSSSFIQRKRRTTINMRNLLEGKTPDSVY